MRVLFCFFGVKQGHDPIVLRHVWAAGCRAEQSVGTSSHGRHAR